MKRLLGLIGLTCLCVLTACFYLGSDVSLVIGGAGFLLFCVSLLIKKSRRDGTLPIAGITIMLSVALFLFHTGVKVYPVIDKYAGETADVVAVLKQEPYYNYNSYCYELDVLSINGEEVDAGIVLYSDEVIMSKPYDVFSFEAELDFKESKSMISRGMYFNVSIWDTKEVVTSSPEKKPILYYISELRNELSRALYLELDADTADFASALFLGDKYAVDKEVKELLRMVGLSHMIVVSGLHLSVMSSVADKILDHFFRKRKYISAIINILTILFYVFLTGCGIPVVRAAVMLIIFQIGKILGRKSDSLNSIGAAALLLCVLNPYSVGDVGMLLSFSATIGIVLWSGNISAFMYSKLDRLSFTEKKFIKWLKKIVVNTISISLAAFVWTLPISILSFGGFSAVSVLSNLIITPALWIVLILIGLCVAFHFVPLLSFVSGFCGLLISIYYDLFIFICGCLSSLPVSYVYANKPYYYVFLIIGISLFTIAAFLRRKSMYEFAVIASVLVLLTGSLIFHINNSKIVSLHIPDTGEGVSVVLESSEGNAVLCSSGDRYATYNLISSINEITPTDRDVLIQIPGRNSHLYSQKVMNEFDYATVLRYDKDVYDIQVNDEETVFGGVYELYMWDKVYVRIIPFDEEVFEYLVIGDIKILILPDNGDCGQLDASYRSADVVITTGLVDNLDLIDCDTLILTGNQKDAADSAKLSLTPKETITIDDDTYIYDINIR